MAQSEFIPVIVNIEASWKQFLKAQPQRTPPYNAHTVISPFQHTAHILDFAVLAVKAFTASFNLLGLGNTTRLKCRWKSRRRGCD
jgi:hypothetical protein